MNVLATVNFDFVFNETIFMNIIVNVSVWVFRAAWLQIDAI
jgi:hypothetical protein